MRTSLRVVHGEWEGMKESLGACLPQSACVLQDGKSPQSFEVFFFSVKDQYWMPDQGSEEEREIGMILIMLKAR